MTLKALCLVIFSVVIIRTRSTVVTIANSVDATLYKNGNVVKTVPRGFNTVHVPLATNDVLSLIVNPYATDPYTLTVKVDIQPRIVWKYSQQVSGNSWQGPNYPQGCSWESARSNDATLVHRGTGGKPTYFRGVIGNTCSSLKLSVAVNERGWIFLNNRHLGDVDSVHSTWTSTESVSEGDVITIKTMSGGIGGVIANAVIDGKNFGTGVSEGWRLSTVAGSQVAQSMSSGFNDCAWNPGSVASTNVIKAPGFPYASGAKYVWDSGAITGDIVVARFVVGRENRCGSAGTSGQTMCSCEMIPPNDWSDCYYFTDPKEYHCKLRKCEPKYMCSSKTTGVICVRRLVIERVVPIDGLVGVCKKIAQRSEMYVPYQQNY